MWHLYYRFCVYLFVRHFNYLEVFQSWKLKLTSKINSKCVHKVSTKINTAESKRHRDFCWRSGNSIKRKTTMGQPNPGYPLFRRQS